MSERSALRYGSYGIVALLVPGVLVGLTVRHRAWNELFFVHSTYYVLLALLLLYVGVRFSGHGESPSLRVWIKENIAGLVATAVVSTVVLLGVTPSFRVLADEANLVGVSKNLYFKQTADFAVTGKWYFENFHALNEVIDRRPALFSFLVSLLHVVRGYHVENAFYLNAILFVLFIFSSYRLAKSLGGEIFGVAAAIAVAVNPNTLVAARSGGFDFLAMFLLLVTIQCFYDYAKQPSPRQLAILSLNLCLFANVRYEGWALLLVAAVVLSALRLVKPAHFQGFGFVYALVPIFLLPRYWQTVAKANDWEQPLSRSLFKISSFFHNGRDYLGIMAHPLALEGPHSPLLMILGVGGCALFVWQVVGAVRSKNALSVRFALFVAALLGVETVISFTYIWGEPVHPASARLFIWLDTFMAFAAAWLLTVLGTRFLVPIALLRRRSGAPVTIFTCLALFVMHVPVASEARFVNALILTRQAAQVWKFFDGLGDKRILILTDRPGLFTIMDYGALDISLANDERGALFELSRHLYQDIYLVQEVDLATGKALPGFEGWPDVEMETALEFQSNDSQSIRISRVKGMPAPNAAERSSDANSAAPSSGASRPEIGKKQRK